MFSLVTIFSLSAAHFRKISLGSPPQCDMFWPSQSLPVYCDYFQNSTSLTVLYNRVHRESYIFPCDNIFPQRCTLQENLTFVSPPKFDIFWSSQSIPVYYYSFQNSTRCMRGWIARIWFPGESPSTRKGWKELWRNLNKEVNMHEI